jgi:hypothetical protein
MHQIILFASGYRQSFTLLIGFFPMLHWVDDVFDTH